jgi:hypothetical protein
MNPVAAPEAATTVPARPRRTLADVATAPRNLAGRVQGEGKKRLTVSAFNSGI